MRIGKYLFEFAKILYVIEFRGFIDFYFYN